MNVTDMLKKLEEHGFNVRNAQADVLGDPEIGRCPVIMNAHYRRKAGQANWTRAGSPINIQLARKLWLIGWDAVHKTFIHELAHLFATDDGHGRRWHELCEHFGAKQGQYHNYSTVLGYKPRPLKIVGVCVDCGRKYSGRRRLNKTWTYTCQCGSKDIQRA